MFDELAALGLGLCRNLQERALAAEDAAEAAMLANAFHRVSRSVRQTLALQAKLTRDAKRDVIEDRIEARAETRRAVDRRRKRVATTVERLIWTEREADEAEDLADQLETLLESAELEDDFADQPLDQLVTHICEELGLERASPGTGEHRPQEPKARGSMGEVKPDDFPLCRPPGGLGDISPVPGEGPRPSG